MYLSKSLSIKLAFLIISLFIGGTIIAVRIQRNQNELKIKTYNSSEKNRDSSVTHDSLMPTCSEKDLNCSISDSDNKTGAEQSASTSVSLDDPNQFVIKNFKRSETKDGKISWEIVADQGSMIPGDTKAKIINAKLKFYRDNGTIYELTAPNADLILSAASVDEATLTGGVIFNDVNGYNIKTERAVFRKAVNLITSDTLTTITNSDLEIIGNKLSYDGNSKILNLSDGVKTTIFAKQ